METVLLCFYCADCESKLQDSVKFQLETLSIFQPQPELVTKKACTYTLCKFNTKQ